MTLDGLEADYDNLREALKWGLEAGGDQGGAAWNSTQRH
jgi:hypothetical protein